MGLRYRKSISFLGGAFRINFSKSGIGYSYGGKGVRITKMANGRTRATLSIPGTGISYVTESSKKRNSKTQKNIGHAYEQSGSVYSYSIENGAVDNIISVEEKDFIKALNNNNNRRIAGSLLLINIILLIIVFVVAIMQNGKPEGFGIFDALLYSWFIICILQILFSIFGKVSLTYDFDEYGKEQLIKINNIVDLIKSNQHVWQVNDVYTNTSTRNHAGAKESVVLTKIKISRKNPKFLRSDITSHMLKLKKEEIYFFPDKILVVYGNTIGAVSYKDLKLTFGNVPFREINPPKDAYISGHTWQYANNNGTPDKRFKNNRQVAICNYGIITGKSDSGINVKLYCSNYNTVEEIKKILQH